jgi:hypothetical protein
MVRELTSLSVMTKQPPPATSRTRSVAALHRQYITAEPLRLTRAEGRR